METVENPLIINQVNNPKSLISHFGFAWKQMWKYFLELLLVAIISMFFEFPTLSFIKSNTNFFSENFFSIDLFIVSLRGFGAFVVFSIAIYVLFILPLEYGFSYIHLLAVRGDKFKVKDMFKVFDNYWNSVFANILSTAIIGFGFMFLIIPGIIFACKLSFVSYLIVDKKMEAVEAVKTSWQMTNGYSLTLFLIGFSSIFLFIFGLIAFFVGVVVSIIWVRVAFASVYLSADIERIKNAAIL